MGSAASLCKARRRPKHQARMGVGGGGSGLVARELDIVAADIFAQQEPLRKEGRPTASMVL